MRRSIVLIACALIFLATGSFQPNNVKAGGIPVIDAASLTQQLTQYLTILMEFEQMLGQTVIQTDQYLQMVRDYQQMLREYQHYLHQLQGIKHMISAGDWRNLMRIIKYYRGKSKRSVIAEMDPEDPNYEEELDTVLENYGHVPRDPAAVETDAQSLGIWSDQYSQEVQQDYNQYDLYKDRMRMVSDNAKKDARFAEDIENHQRTVDNLGDESDLATLQEIALQNITLMKQKRAISQTLNQLLMNTESQEAMRAAKKAKSREAEINRLKNRQPTQLLGRDRWGNFKKERTLLISNEQRKYICTLYAKTFNKPYYEPCINCSPKPLIKMIEMLDKVYETYNDK